MIIKYLFVNNLEELINSIIKELCKNNISYVYIKETNELHFDKYIFKFYTKNTSINFFNIINEHIPINKVELYEPEDLNTVLKKIVPKKYCHSEILKHNKETNMKLKKQYTPNKTFRRR